MNVKKYNIIIVDNNKVTLEKIKNFFSESITLNIFTFSDPNKALKNFRKKINSKNKYDLAIIDWNMPTITGDILSVLMKTEDPSIKTVLYTGSQDNCFLTHFKSYKFDEILSKSNDISELNSIFNLLDSSYTVEACI